MTQRADYTADEWALLQTTAEFVGLRMLSVSRSGPIGKLRELVALAACMTPGAVPLQFARNELVLSLLEDIHIQDAQNAESLSLHDINRLATVLASARLHTLAFCEEVAELLVDKTPWTEADELKRWLLWVAGSVARASGDGWLGLGRRVSAGEVRMLSQIATALHISPIMTVPALPGLTGLRVVQSFSTDDGREHRWGTREDKAR